MNREKYEISDLMLEIDGSPDGVGYDISLSKIYDDIKEARFEEDDTVSFGVWERDLKKADWGLAEKLCVDSIKQKSKDIKILGWLLESLIVLDGFRGVFKGIEILNAFVKTFWNTCYPRNEDNSSDQEQKLKILDWIFDVLEKRSRFVPFAWYNSDDFVNLYNYEYAVDLKNTMIRLPNSSNEILESAKKSGIKTLDEVQNMINIMNQKDSAKLLESVKSIKESKLNFDQTISEFLEENINSFSGLISNLEKIEKLLLPKKSEKNDNNESPMIKLDETSIPRDKIYDEIDSLSKKLAIIERHSPSSSILNLVVSWKEKTLLEIMDDLKSGNSEAHRLLKILIN